MAVQEEYVIRRYVGLSTDDKPTDALIGSTFWESDTTATFKWDGTSWAILSQSGVQYPLPTDGDSVYAKDIKDSLSNVGTFTGADLKTLFNNLDDTITSTDVGGLSYLEFYLVRPAKVASVAMVAKTGSFSNVKVIFKDRQGTEISTIDDSANDALYTSHDYSVAGAKNVCCIRLEFHTTNEISLSFVYIRKTLAISLESIDSIISEVNTTSTLLLADETFTGVTEDVKDTAVVQVAVYSDQSSATLGLKFQFSIDGTNWDHVDLYNYIGGTGKAYSIQPVARYFRIVYTNGSVNQAEFGLQTVFKSVYSKPSSHRVGDLISPEDDAELVKSVLAAQKPNGDFTPIDATAGGNLKVSVEEFESGITTVNADRTTNLDGEAGLNTNAMMFGRVSDTVVKNARIDASTESIITIGYEHHETHSGSHFFHNDIHDLAINNVLDYQITTPDTTKWAHFVVKFTTKAETEYFLYEAASVITPGSLNGYNSNRNSANTHSLIVREIENTTIGNANADTDVSGATLLWHGISGAGREGGNINRQSELVLKQNTVYALRFIASAAGYINTDFEWYEHTDRN